VSEGACERLGVADTVVNGELVFVIGFDVAAAVLDWVCMGLLDLYTDCVCSGLLVSVGFDDGLIAVVCDRQ